MIILVKNNKDAFEACLNAMNEMLLTPENSSTGSNITYKQKAHIDEHLNIIYNKSSNKIMNYRTLLRVFRLSRFMRFNILAPFCSAASTLASSKETKKDKFLFGVKMFGLVLLSALILPVALVSHPITHSIGRIVSKIKGNMYENIVPEEITFAEFLYKAQNIFGYRVENCQKVNLEDVFAKCNGSKYNYDYKYPVIESVFQTKYTNKQGTNEQEVTKEYVHTIISETTASPCGKVDQLMAFMGFYR